MSADRVLVVGVGALGCLFAARLSAAGIPVSMVGAWPEALAALLRDGVRIQDAEGGQKVYPVLASSDPTALGSCSFALVLVKSWQTEAAARRIAACLPQGGLALTLQNGLGNRETLAGILGEERTAAGVTTTGSRLLGPGVVLSAGEGVVTLESRPALDGAAGLLAAAGFQVERTPDLTGLQWGKLVINAAVNPLTAILGVANGELLERPAARALLGEVALETAGIAYVGGIALPYPDPVAAVERVAALTAGNHSSMLQDVRRGAPTEIDAINGAVAAQAAALGLSAPLNWSLWQLVLSLRREHSLPKEGFQP